MRIGKVIQVTVLVDGRAISGDVIFLDQLDIEEHLFGNYYTYVSPSSMARLAQAINSLGMQVELDEYGVPTWTRPEPPCAPS